MSVAIPHSVDWRAAMYAGLAAGVIATVAQLLLWWIYWDVLPDIFFRDARLTAAIILGPAVLPPPVSFDAGVMAAATAVHFSLSIVCSLMLAVFITRAGMVLALLLGAAFGGLVYLVNMYGFVLVFPWFEVARDWSTLLTHIAFGVAAAGVYKILVKRRRWGGGPHAWRAA